MTKVREFHTSTPEYPPEHREVYHDQSECKFGKAINREHQVLGRGGKKRCSECERLG